MNHPKTKDHDQAITIVFKRAVEDGFSLDRSRTIATAIIGTISSIAYPSYIDVKDRAKAR